MIKMKPSQLLMMQDDDIYQSAQHSFSASEDEADDDTKHSKMVNAITSMPTSQSKKLTKKKQLRSEPKDKVSESHISSGVKERVNVDQLVSSLKKTNKYKKLRQTVDTFRQEQEKLETPLERHVQAKIQRSAAYSGTQKHVSRWQATVKRNREAEHLSFPLNATQIGVQPTGEFVKNFKPSTPLEKQIMQLLHGNKYVEEPDKPMSRAEEEALRAMSLKEAQERRKELQHLRALQSYYETKCKREKKIKSKKYHKIKRVTQERLQKKKLQELQETDSEQATELIEKLKKQRMMERMNLRHKNTGKWAKSTKFIGKYDPKKREELMEQLDRGKQLTEKISTSQDQEDDESESDRPDVRAHTQKTTPHVIKSDPNNPWLTPTSGDKYRKVKEVTKTQMQYKKLEPVVNYRVGKDGESDDEGGLMETTQQIRTEVDIDRLAGHESDDDDDNSGFDSESEIVSESPVKNKVKMEKSLEKFISKRTGARKTAAEKIDPLNASSEISQTKDAGGRVPVRVDPDKFLTLNKKPTGSLNLDPTDVDDEMDEDEEQLRNIQEAFAEDDVVEDFDRQKAAKTEADKPKDLDLTLPGWGSWGGTDIKVKDAKRKRFKVKAKPAAPRRDRNLPDVIINERANEPISKLQVAKVPYPYTDRGHFESTICQPVGRTWNTEASFHSLVQPRVTTRAGAIIAPMTEDDLEKTKIVDDDDDKLTIDDVKSDKDVRKRRKPQPQKKSTKKSKVKK